MALPPPKRGEMGTFYRVFGSMELSAELLDTTRDWREASQAASRAATRWHVGAAGGHVPWGHRRRARRRRRVWAGEKRLSFPYTPTYECHNVPGASSGRTRSRGSA